MVFIILFIINEDLPYFPSLLFKAQRAKPEKRDFLLFFGFVARSLKIKM